MHGVKLHRIATNIPKAILRIPIVSTPSPSTITPAPPFWIREGNSRRHLTPAHIDLSERYTATSYFVFREFNTNTLRGIDVM